MKTQTCENRTMLMAALLLVTATAPTLAHAHMGVGETSGLLHGLSHPFLGIDHLAAMVAVGLWAAQRGGRAIWMVPLTFVTVMLMGGAMGIAGVPVPLVEPGIVASLLVLGVLIAAAVRLPLAAASLLVALFAVFHGYAHGVETPETASGLTYGVGFITATAILHACGIGLALLARQWGSTRLVRYAGGATAALGVYLSVA